MRRQGGHRHREPQRNGAVGRALGWESTKDPSSSPGSVTLDNSLNIAGFLKLRGGGWRLSSLSCEDDPVPLGEGSGVDLSRSGKEVTI